MAGPLRLEFTGALYYVTSRGDRREDIFLVDEDRKNWLDVLANRGELLSKVVFDQLNQAEV